MQSSAKTPDAYVSGLPPDRREAIAKVRATILENLPPGYEETVDFGLLSYVVPLKRFPVTYNGHPLMYAALASQKNYMSVYLMTVYGDSATTKWFKDEYKKSGKKLDMGKSCIRFKTLEDLPLELIGRAVARTPVDKYVAFCEKVYAARTKKPARK
jgi:uncharacterized protein YdhG (YjbR/CyaY superfamily)